MGQLYPDAGLWLVLLSTLGVWATQVCPSIALANKRRGKPTDPPTPVVRIRVRVPERATPGEELRYRILVENVSRASAHHVLVRNALPANVRYVRANPEPTGGFLKEAKQEENPSAKSRTKRELRWDFGTLGPCSRKEIVLVVVPTGGGDVSTCARVQFEHGQCVKTRLPAPSLQLRIQSPSKAVLLDAVTFVFEVTNNGSTPVREVVLQATLPDELIFLNSKPPNSPVSSGTSGADAPQPQPPPKSPSGSQHRTEKTSRSSLRGQLAPSRRASGKPPSQSEGDGPLVWKLGTLDPGQSRRVECYASATRVGTFTCKASVTAAVGSEASVPASAERLEQHTSQTVTVLEPRLTALKTGPLHRLVGRPTTYEITLTNPGPVTLRELHVTDELFQDVKVREGMEFVSASDGGKLVGQQVQWKLDSLKPGARRRLRMVLKAKQSGTFINVVTISSDRILARKIEGPKTRFTNPDGLHVEIVKGLDPLVIGGTRSSTATETGERGAGRQSPPVREGGLRGDVVLLGPRTSQKAPTGRSRPEHHDFPLVREGGGPSPPASSEANYLFRIINTAKKETTNATLTITLPPELQVIAARGPTGTRQKGNTISFAPLPTLAAGSEVNYTLRLRAVKPLEGSKAARIRAQVTSDQTEKTRPIQQEETIIITR